MPTVEGDALRRLEALRDEAAAMLVGAGEKFAERMWVNISVDRDPPKRETEQEDDAMLERFVTELAGVPADILAHAVHRHIRQSPYFPKAADILAIADPLVAERERILNTADSLLAKESEAA